MTLEDLLSFNSDQLKAISEEEMIKLCAPKFNLTRPDIATANTIKKEHLITTKTQEMLAAEAKKKRAKEIAAKLGLELNI